ncbi:MAG TPA: alpha-mannosidase [Terriglobales bacterium]|nr:alpha-mannosidase [Terriglobales bacterium]
MKTAATFSLLLLLIASAAAAQQAPAQQNKDAYKPVLDHLAALITYPLPEWHIHTDLPHPEDPSLDDSGWQTIKADWSRDDNAPNHWKGTRVLRRWVEVPKAVNGYGTYNARVKLDLKLGSDRAMVVTVFSNGSVIFRGSEELLQPILLTETAGRGQKFLIAVRVDASDVDTAIFPSALLIEPPASRPDPSLLREEILAARPLIAAYAQGHAEREQILNAAVNAIDFSPLARGSQAAFDESLRRSQQELEKLNPWMKGFTIRAVGNSHIDMAWLWPWTETVEVVRNTFRSVLDLMNEYPDFKFTMSSARAYQWIEEKYPDMFAEIKQRVKEGRWEVIGGMWVEPDLNMPGGESLTRQILVGKRYFQQKFGVDIRIGWNPDSFGYNWQLPQIYKRSGINYFVTQKLLWAHEFTTFPYRLFWWQSPDGSKLLTYFPHDYAGGIEAQRLAEDLSQWAPSMYGENFNNTPEMMHLYGVGDHGGGPTREMLDNAAKLMSPNVVFPKLEFSTATAFFNDLDQNLPNMKVPVWNDELYFQYHRGVFTTQADTKQRIRLTEEKLLDAEKLASLAMLYGREYPQSDFEQAWKRLLFDDFHDIFPGSGIAVNYLDAKRNLEDVQRVAGNVARNSLNEIAAHINTQGDGTPLLVFNTLSWARTELIEADVQFPAPVKNISVVDSNGNQIEAQLLSVEPETNRARVLLLADIPSMGYKVYFVRGADSQAPTTTAMKASTTELENEFVRLKVDPHSGCITSLVDKRSNTEALAPAETDTGGPKNFACGNLLQTFYDKPKQWDAWNIDADFEKQHWDLDTADSVELIENGPSRAIIRVKKHFQNSAFVQDITMYAGMPRVDVKMQADWHEKHILLKVAFPLSAHNSKATFEIPFGSIERPTTRNTPAERAEFEVPALRWADISEADHGFSLLNDSKYGYDAKGNVLRLSLLRSPAWPDPHADEGHHEFTYSLYPHGGDWKRAQTVRRGYELNYKPIAVQLAHHQGTLPAEHSFLSIDSDNVVLTALKKAEDDDSLIARYFEWAGEKSDVKLSVSEIQKASETNLMEKKLNEIPVANGTVSVPTSPYEIKTVELSALPAAASHH